MMKRLLALLALAGGLISHAYGQTYPGPSFSPNGVTMTTTPAYNLASNTLATPLFLPLNSGSQTVSASTTFDFIRGSNSDGTDISFTVGASGIATGPFFQLTSASGSNASSNVYGGVFHCQNAGPGNCRGAHLAGIGLSGSTGSVSAAGLEITPVATSSGAWGAFASLISSGVNGKAVGYGIETNGDTYSVGFGSTVNPVGYTNTAYRAWMATASGANARAFSTLQNDGTEIQYIKKTGEVVSTSLIAGVQGSFETNGIAIGASTIARSAAAGSMNISAGSNAGNVIQLVTGGTTRLQISDTGAQATGALAINGATSGATTLTASATGGHTSFTSSSTPTLTAGCNGAGSAVSGNDLSGTITGQTAAATTCTLQFGTAFGAAPNCVVMGISSPLTTTATPSTTTLVVNFASTANYKFTYFCPGV